MAKRDGGRRVLERLRSEVALARPGSRLPTVRELMDAYRVGPATVERAIAQLASEGLVTSRPGSGTFVAARKAEAPQGDLTWQTVALGQARSFMENLASLFASPPAGALSLSAGQLQVELQPAEQLSAAMRFALRRPGVWGRIPREGLETLRTWFAQQVGNGLRASDVIICPGGSAAITTALRALVPPGGAVAVESPTYLGALTAARSAGLRIVPVPTDRDGARTDRLADTLRSSGARVFFCQPTFANPTGAVLSPERREQILEQVKAAGAFIVEDDWARDLAAGAEPPPPPLASSDTDGHVVYIRSLTKPTAPGLRVAALCARGAALARLRATRLAEDSFVSGPLQEAALHLVTSPGWKKHLAAVSAALAVRRDTLVSAVREHLGPDTVTLVPGGGFHVWVRLPDEVSDADVATRAARENVIVARGGPWFPEYPLGSFLRLSFSGAPPELLRRAVSLLARCVR